MNTLKNLLGMTPFTVAKELFLCRSVSIHLEIDGHQAGVSK
ncbi:hypothetical protein SynMVIR181_01667 [Synechococcus sp. MVIR-18-1]|nr:hypothetical protein SynMVIR181_01667 [Synechococcus sp. MVIR-18-1]